MPFCFISRYAFVAALFVGLAVGAAAQVTDPATGEPIPGAVPADVSIAPTNTAERGGDDLTLIKHLAAGETRGIALAGDVLYRSNGGYFEALDVADPADAQVLSRVTVETSIVQDVVVDGDRAYVVSSRSNFPQGAGLHVVDISDPANMTIVGQALGQTAFGLALSDDGNYAVVGASTGGVSVYDISDDAAPSLVATVAVPGASVLKVAVEGDVAYVSGGGAGFATIDLSTPTAPVVLGTASTEGFGTNVALDSAEDIAYVIANGGALIAFDVSDPAAIAEVGQFAIGSSQVRGIQLDGDTAYVTSRDSFQALDISDPASITEIGSFPFSNTGSGQSVIVADGTAYVGNRFDGVRILDVADLMSIEEIALVQNGGFSFKVFVQDDIAYVSDLIGEYRLIDLSDPENAEIVGRADALPNTSNSTVRDGVAYVVDRTGAAGTGITRFDVSDPTDPTAIDTFTTGGQSFGIDLSGDEAYVANGFFSFLSVGLEDGAPTEILADFNPEGNAYDTRVQDDVAYITTFGGGLVTADVSDPAMPVRLNAGVVVGGFTLSLDLDGDRAYLGDGQVGLNVVDISDPAVPQSLGTGSIAGIASGVAYSQGFAYIADEGFGLRQYDVTDPSNPVETSAVISADRMTDVDVEGDLVVAVDAGGGVYLFRARDNTPVAGESDGTPGTFALDAGYPNPFSARTTLRYRLPEASDVTLDVFNVLGQRVATLVDARQEAGSHEATFRSDDLPGGVYFYTLTAGTHTANGRVTLVR